MGGSRRMPGNWIGIAAVNGLIAVAAGAYAAHGMKVRAGVYPAEWTETASRYQMWHALALLSVALIWREMTAKPWLKAAAWGVLLGLVLLCGRSAEGRVGKGGVCTWRCWGSVFP